MTLRELMTDGIKSCSWLDWHFNRDNAPRPDAYVTYLATLSDDDFLDTYNQVHTASNELD